MGISYGEATFPVVLVLIIESNTAPAHLSATKCRSWINLRSEAPLVSQSSLVIAGTNYGLSSVELPSNQIATQPDAKLSGKQKTQN